MNQMKVSGFTSQEIAKSLGRTTKSVERKLAYLAQVAQDQQAQEECARAALDAVMQPDDPPTPKVVEPKSVDGSDFWKSEYKRVSKMLEEERWKKTEVEALIEQVDSLAPKSYDPAPKVEWPARHQGSAQSAVLLLSDQHVGQVVEPDQTLGFGGYNIQTFLLRLKRLEQAVYSILHDHVTTPIEELVVPMLGDMLHGCLGHATEAGQRHTLFEQFFIAAHANAQFLRNISALVPKVRIYTAVGNHTRWQNQHKMPTDNRYSNLDQFVYAMVQGLTRDIPTMEWHLDKQPFAIFDVQGWTFMGGHGDNLRGGDKALGIPAHSIGRNVSSTMGLRARAHQSLVNYYLFGHVHKPLQIPHTLGEIITNGGFPGVDGYGLAEGFQAYWPSQKFMLIHPTYGRAACYDLRLDFPPQGNETYQIPNV